MSCFCLSSMFISCLMFSVSVTNLKNRKRLIWPSFETVSASAELTLTVIESLPLIRSHSVVASNQVSLLLHRYTAHLHKVELCSVISRWLLSLSPCEHHFAFTERHSDRCDHPHSRIIIWIIHKYSHRRILCIKSNIKKSIKCDFCVCGHSAIPNFSP